MTGIDYEPRMLFNPLRDGGDGSGGVKGEYEHVSSLSQKIIMRTKDILSSSRMKRLPHKTARTGKKLFISFVG